MGSHVMGQAGYKIQTKKDAKVNRITGLDPAAPHFHTKMTADNDLTKCLDKTDGKFVDVIHSNTQCFGMDEAVVLFSKKCDDLYTALLLGTCFSKKNFKVI